MAMAEAADLGSTERDWHLLRSNPDYKADWRAYGAAPSFVEAAGFALRAQTQADLQAARWGLLAWEDPRERSKFKPFWADDGMLTAVVAEPGSSSAPPLPALMRATGMTISGLRLLDGALILKAARGRRVEQIRVSEGDSFDLERTGIELLCRFDGIPPTAWSRLENVAAILTPRRRSRSDRQA